MTINFLFGFIGVVFALAALIIIGDVLQRKRPPVRIIVNVKPPMLYSENHIDQPAYLRRDTEEE